MTEMVHDFGGNVVPLFTERQKMSFPAIAQMDAYWEALRRGQLIPKRSDVDPRGIEAALEHAFILERIAAGVDATTCCRVSIHGSLRIGAAESKLIASPPSSQVP